MRHVGGQQALRLGDGGLDILRGGVDVARQRELHADGRGALAILRAHALHAGDRRELALEGRSEEHTSELQSLRHLVCRLLLEKKKDSGAFIRGCSISCCASSWSRLCGWM